MKKRKNVKLSVKLHKAIASVIFIGCWYGVFAVVGGLEQGTIGFFPCILAIAVIYAVMLVSGLVAGAVTLW